MKATTEMELLPLQPELLPLQPNSSWEFYERWFLNPCLFETLTKKKNKLKRKWKKAIHNRETTPRQEWNAEAEWRSWSDVWVAFLDWGWGRSLLKSCNFLWNVSLKFVFKKWKITKTANLQGTNVVRLNLKTDNKCYRIIMKKKF